MEKTVKSAQKNFIYKKDNARKGKDFQFKIVNYIKPIKTYVIYVQKDIYNKMVIVFSKNLK